MARWLTLAVLTLQVGLLVMFWLYPDDPPQSGTLWQALWARANMPPFYPLVGLLVVGPPATLLAWSMRGTHRRVLAWAWVVFLPVLLIAYSHRVYVMLWVLWKFG